VRIAGWFCPPGQRVFHCEEKVMLSLLRRTLVIVAHPDDEAGGCGALLQRIHDPIVLFCTDGAPDDHWFWSSYQSRSAYARTRRCEAVAALQIAGIRSVRFVSEKYPACSDQRLFRVLPAALHALVAAVHDYRPDALLTLAYEGGHPDHDSCSFLASIVGRRFGLPVWEMPLYHRLPSGQLACQTFMAPNGTECVLHPSAEEASRKREMLAAYKSQPELPRFVVSTTEQFRRQPLYDYSQPPHVGMLNYEAWQWPMAGWQVSDAFVQCLRSLGKRWDPPLAPSKMEDHARSSAGGGA
jgi:N-acetylglucosamine malate deacetylase 2